MKSKLAIALLIAALLSIGAWRGYAQTGKQKNVTYEYAVVEDPTADGNFTHDEAVKKLSEYGAEGWELVGIRQVGNGVPWLYLKRTVK